MKRLQIVVEGEDDSDVEFLKDRCVAAVEDVIEEYKDNLDQEVTVDSEWLES